MDQSPISKADIKKSQHRVLQEVLAGKSKVSQRGDDLTKLAAQRNADTVKFTHVMLRTRLARDLDTTIASHLETNPEIKEQFFIAIMTDDNFSIEVVKRSEAQAIIDDLPDAKAKQDLSNDPVGYFSKKDFPAKTSEDIAYRELKDKLEQYFKRNLEVIQYLRSNPDTDVALTDLYRAPS